MGENSFEKVYNFGRILVKESAAIPPHPQGAALWAADATHRWGFLAAKTYEINSNEWEYFVLCNQTAAQTIASALQGVEGVSIRGKEVPYYTIIFELFGDPQIVFAYEKATPGEVGFKRVVDGDLQ